MTARNFQEYLASTGRANSGLSAQARMQNANNLNTSINSLNAGEAAALADINRRTTDANNAYDTGLSGANAQIEANYIQNLLNERNKELERQMQEKQYQESIRQFNANKALQERQFEESVRQFNENLALQRAQMQSRFSSGSGGGGRSSGGSSNKTKATYTKTGDTVSGVVGQVSGTPTRAIGGISIVDTPVYTKNGKKYYKNSKGKYVQIK